MLDMFDKVCARPCKYGEWSSRVDHLFSFLLSLSPLLMLTWSTPLDPCPSGLPQASSALSVCPYRTVASASRLGFQDRKHVRVLPSHCLRPTAALAWRLSRQFSEGRSVPGSLLHLISGVYCTFSCGSCHLTLSRHCILFGSLQV